MNLPQNKTKLGMIITVFAAIIFGIYPSAAREAYEHGANIACVILVTTFCRMVGLYMLSSYFKEKPFQSLKESRLNIVAGVFQAMSIIGILGGTYFLPGAVVIVIVFSSSLMLLIFSALRGKMPLTISNFAATCAALFGLALVLNISADLGSAEYVGCGLAFLGAFATFVRAYIYAQQGQLRSPSIVGTESFIVTFMILLPLLFWQMPTIPSSNYGLIMLALCSLTLTVASLGMFYGVTYLGAYRFNMVMKVEPVFTTLFGVVLAKDYLNTMQYLGIAIVLISIMISQLYGHSGNKKPR